MKKDGATIAQFTYDGDGKQVKSVIDGVTTLYVGGHYEIKNPGSGQEITKYYFAGAQRIAMRRYTVPVETKLEFLLSDHLGSTSITTDSTGAKTSEIKYKPWGEVRYAWTKDQVPGLPTDYTFTGQYSYMDDPTTNGVSEGFGLMFYNARWYDPYLNRFIQPDSIIPNPGNSQDWDRYAYVNNNPIKYNDPSGHVPEWFYTVLGATAQYMDDVSLGMFSHVAGSLDVVNIPAYQDGRKYGRGVAIVQSSTETVVGAYVAAASVAAMGPTAGGGAACAATTAGVCAIPAGVAITAEAVGAVGGTAVAGHGALMAAKMNGDPLGNSSSQWGLESIFDDPSMLDGKTPDQIADIIQQAQDNGWQVGTLTRGSRAGDGFIMREYVNGKATGRMIEWHPGGGHHGPSPYWKVSSPRTGTTRIGPQFSIPK